VDVLVHEVRQATISWPKALFESLRSDIAGGGNPSWLLGLSLSSLAAATEEETQLPLSL
jgi:hypothetical protein